MPQVKRIIYEHQLIVNRLCMPFLEHQWVHVTQIKVHTTFFWVRGKETNSTNLILVPQEKLMSNNEIVPQKQSVLHLLQFIRGFPLLQELKKHKIWNTPSSRGTGTFPGSRQHLQGCAWPVGFCCITRKHCNEKPGDLSEFCYNLLFPMLRFTLLFYICRSHIYTDWQLMRISFDQEDEIIQIPIRIWLTLMTLFGDFYYPSSPDVATFLLRRRATAFGSTVLIISPKRANLAVVMQMLLEAHNLLRKSC